MNRDDGAKRRSIVPIVFRDKESALDGAVALMRIGQQEGPGFQMRRTALVAYYQLLSREQLQPLAPVARPSAASPAATRS